MKNTAPREDFTDADIKIGKRATWAVGLPAIEHAMIPSEEEMGTARTAKVSLTIVWESTPLTIPREFPRRMG